METLESQLQKQREADGYSYETDLFTKQIIARDHVEHPKVGNQAPSFSLPNEHGDMVSLEEMLQDGPVILSFFKGEWCSYCDLELKAMERSLPEFKKYGATVFGISPHTVSISYMLKEKKNLSYNILSDAGNELAYSYGLRFPLDDEFKDIMSGFGLDFNVVNAGEENKDTLPIPGTFVVGRDGKIVYAFVDSDHTKRAEPSEIVACLMSIAE